MIRFSSLLALLLSIVAASGARAADSARFDFRRGSSGHVFTVEGADDGRFEAERGRHLDAWLDSNEPASRLVAPLGFELDGASSFELVVELEIVELVGSPDDFFQMSFGLVRSGVTGLNRTGTSLPTAPWFLDDSDTWDALELSYYPNETSFGGPFLQPTVFGAASGSPFANFAANFGPSADLGDNGPGEITALPAGRRLRLRLAHDACARELVTTLYELGSGDPVELATGLEPLDLSFLNATGTFHVDAFAINAYQDLADYDPSTTSLVGRVRFFSATVARAGGLEARLLPVAVNGNAPPPARVRVTGWGGESLPEVRLVEAGGDPLDVALEARRAGRDAFVVEVERDLGAGGGLVLDVGGCPVAVAGPRWIAPR